MINPLTELALEELEATAQAPGGENALALVNRWRMGAATAEDLQVLKDYMARIAEEVSKASNSVASN
jgi:hypothetical protein